MKVPREPVRSTRVSPRLVDSYTLAVRISMRVGSTLFSTYGWRKRMFGSSLVSVFVLPLTANPTLALLT